MAADNKSVQVTIATGATAAPTSQFDPLFESPSTATPAGSSGEHVTWRQFVRAECPGAVSAPIFTPAACAELAARIEKWYAAEPSNGAAIRANGDFDTFEGLGLARLPDWLSATRPALMRAINERWLAPNSCRRLEYAHGIAIRCSAVAATAPASAFGADAKSGGGAVSGKPGNLPPAAMKLATAVAAAPTPVPRALHSGGDALELHVDRWDVVLNINLLASNDLAGGELLLACHNRANAGSAERKEFHSSPCALPDRAALLALVPKAAPFVPPASGDENAIRTAELVHARQTKLDAEKRKARLIEIESEYQKCLTLNYYVYSHAVGRGLLHAGGQMHRSRRVHSGRRINLIIGFSAYYQFQGWNRLSTDLQLRILSFNGIAELVSISCVSRTFHCTYLPAEVLWRTFWKRAYDAVPPVAGAGGVLKPGGGWEARFIPISRLKPIELARLREFGYYIAPDSVTQLPVGRVTPESVLALATANASVVGDEKTVESGQFRPDMAGQAAAQRADKASAWESFKNFFSPAKSTPAPKQTSANAKGGATTVAAGSDSSDPARAVLAFTPAGQTVFYRNSYCTEPKGGNSVRYKSDDRVIAYVMKPNWMLATTTATAAPSTAATGTGGSSGDDAKSTKPDSPTPAVAAAATATSFRAQYYERARFDAISKIITAGTRTRYTPACTHPRSVRVSIATAGRRQAGGEEIDFTLMMMPLFVEKPEPTEPLPTPKGGTVAAAAGAMPALPECWIQ